MRYSTVLLLLFSLSVPVVVCSQQAEAPLGDVARRARQAHSSEPRATMLATNDEEEPALPRDPEKLIANACTLLSADEAERVFGVPLPAAPHLEADPHGGSACTYTASWGDGINVAPDHTCVKVNHSCDAHDRTPACVVPDQSCARFSLTVHSVLVSQNGRDAWREHVDRSPVIAQLAGIGDEADRVPGVKGLNLRKGPYFLTVVVGYEPLNRTSSPTNQTVALDKELEVARKIVARLSDSATDNETAPADNPAPSDAGSAQPPDAAAQNRQQESVRKQRQACIDLADVVYKEKFDALKEADAPPEAFDQLSKQRDEAIKQCQTEHVRNEPQPSQPDM